MKMSCYLGIDAGTSGIKTIVMDNNGVIHGIGYRECDLVTPQPGWVEQDPLMWWEACDEAVRQALQNSGKAGEIAGIGFSGQMQGCTPFDKDMRPLGNSLIWLDQRSVHEVQEIYSLISEQELMLITANECLNSFWAPKLLWLRNNEPERYEKIHKILFAKDYLRYRMTGEISTEVSDASLSFLMDVPGRKWSKRIFEALDIPFDIVPERLVESQDITGTLQKKTADSWGLKAGIPVIAGGGDQPAGGVGTGIVKSGVVGTAIGTSGVVFGCVDKPLFDDKNRAVYSMAHSVPDKWCFLGLVLSAGGTFKWLRDTIFSDRKTAMEREGLDVYDYMTDLASRSCPGSEGLTFLPYLNGEKTPINDADARGVFFGLSHRHGLSDICRSVMEGVTFALRDTIEICREMGTEVHEIRASGGGAKSGLWRQILADISQANVLSMNIEEGPAAGGAILAAVGAGEFANVYEACDSLLKVVKVTESVTENIKRYDEYYQTYKDLYSALKPLFSRQAQIVAEYL